MRSNNYEPCHLVIFFSLTALLLRNSNILLSLWSSYFSSSICWYDFPPECTPVLSSIAFEICDSFPAVYWRSSFPCLSSWRRKPSHPVLPETPLLTLPDLPLCSDLRGQPNEPFHIFKLLCHLLASRQNSINEVCALSPHADYRAWSWCPFRESISFNNLKSGRLWL